MNSLGRPAEALILRGEEREREAGIHVKHIQKYGSEGNPMSASELLEEIHAETGIISAQRVAENLEHVRSSWVSRLQRRGRPTGAEFRELAQRVRDGFTARQLAEYYGQGEVDVTTNPDDLYALYSNDLYTRSAWSSGITNFANAKLGSIKNSAKQQENAAGSRDASEMLQQSNDPKRVSLDSKAVLTGKILRGRWRIRTVEDEEAVGEVDIWPHHQHLRVLLIHSKHSFNGRVSRISDNMADQDILQRLSQRYGAKIDASADEGVIRISADLATSGDVLKFVIYMLGRIRHREVDIPPEPSIKRRNVKVVSAKERLRNSTFLEQLQQITNTIVELAPRSTETDTLGKVNAKTHMQLWKRSC